MDETFLTTTKKPKTEKSENDKMRGFLKKFQIELSEKTDEDIAKISTFFTEYNG